MCLLFLSPMLSKDLNLSATCSELAVYFDTQTDWMYDKNITCDCSAVPQPI